MIRVTLSIALLLVSLPAAAQHYIRAGVGYERSGDVTLRDVDCSSAQPPALFGCGDGADGLPFGARGDFGNAAPVELAVGWEPGRFRAEVTLTRRGFELDADANFIGVTGPQPVTADVHATSALITGAFDVAPQSWRVRPYVTAAAGVSHNDIGSLTFQFPGIAHGAVTVLRGGTELDFAWRAGAGVSIALSGDTTLDVSAHHNDLGAIRTVHGNATIIRPNRRLDLDIAPVETDLETRGVTISIRQRF